MQKYLSVVERIILGFLFAETFVESNEKVETKSECDKMSSIVSEDKLPYNVPSHEELMAIKRKKKLLSTGTEHFNSNPKKGIQYLQEQGLLSTPLEAYEIASFLRENPHLDKQKIGEFISHRSNLQILEYFVK